MARKTWSLMGNLDGDPLENPLARNQSKIAMSNILANKQREEKAALEQIELSRAQSHIPSQLSPQQVRSNLSMSGEAAAPAPRSVQMPIVPAAAPKQQKRPSILSKSPLPAATSAIAQSAMNQFANPYDALIAQAAGAVNKAPAAYYDNKDQTTDRSDISNTGTENRYLDQPGYSALEQILRNSQGYKDEAAAIEKYKSNLQQMRAARPRAQMDMSSADAYLNYVTKGQWKGPPQQKDLGAVYDANMQRREKELSDREQAQHEFPTKQLAALKAGSDVEKRAQMEQKILEYGMSNKPAGGAAGGGMGIKPSEVAREISKFNTSYYDTRNGFDVIRRALENGTYAQFGTAVQKAGRILNDDKGVFTTHDERRVVLETLMGDLARWQAYAKTDPSQKVPKQIIDALMSKLESSEQAFNEKSSNKINSMEDLYSSSPRQGDFDVVPMFREPRERIKKTEAAQIKPEKISPLDALAAKWAAEDAGAKNGAK